MATRWKREPTETLILMHAHNRWSMWNDALLQAVDDLGIPWAETAYPNCSGDGSWDREYYVSSPVLEKAGGMCKVYEIASQHHAEMMGE